MSPDMGDLGDDRVCPKVPRCTLDTSTCTFPAQTWEIWVTTGFVPKCLAAHSTLSLDTSTCTFPAQTWEVWATTGFVPKCLAAHSTLSLDTFTRTVARAFNSARFSSCMDSRSACMLSCVCRPPLALRTHMLCVFAVATVPKCVVPQHAQSRTEQRNVKPICLGSCLPRVNPV